jgi:hypothetical protein
MKPDSCEFPLKNVANTKTQPVLIRSMLIQKLIETPVLCCIFSMPPNGDPKHCVFETGANRSPLSGLMVKTPGSIIWFVHVTVPPRLVAGLLPPLASARP